MAGEKSNNTKSKLIRIILILVISHFSSSAFTQAIREKGIYLTGELHVGNYLGIDGSINYQIKENLTLKLGYVGNVRRPRTRPDDYTPGIIGIFFGWLLKPYDQMSNYQIGIGKTLDLNTSKRVRMNFSIGLGYTTINEPENWTPRNTTRVVENYSWNYRKYSTASIIINPKIELLESFYDVVTISPMLIINKDRTYIGTGMGRTLGF